MTLSCIITSPAARIVALAGSGIGVGTGDGTGVGLGVGETERPGVVVTVFVITEDSITGVCSVILQPDRNEHKMTKQHVIFRMPMDSSPNLLKVYNPMTQW